MQIICLVYDEIKNKVLTQSKGMEENLVYIYCDKEKDYFNPLQAVLVEILGVKVLKSDLSTLFKSEEQIVLLLNADCCGLQNFEWIDLENLKLMTGVNKIALSKILNLIFGLTNISK